MRPRLPGLFVVGTDTGVGKTRVAAAVVRALVGRGRRVGAVKPISTGSKRVGEDLIAEDTERLREALGGDVPRESVTPLYFEEPLAPCVAARRLGFVLSPGVLRFLLNKVMDWWADRADVMVIEGIGGLLCPITDSSTLIDLAIELDYPLVIVTRRGLGTLSHTMLTVEAAKLRGLRIAGIIVNSSAPETHSPAEQTNVDELSRRLPDVAILAVLPHEPDTPLPDAILSVDWFSLALPPREMPPSTEPEGEPHAPVRTYGDVIPSPGRSSSSDRHPAAPAFEPMTTPDSDAASAAPIVVVAPLPSSASSDELSLSLVHARPDPLLGGFENENPPSAVAEGPEAASEHARADAFDALAHLNLSPVDRVVPAPEGSSADALAAFEIGNLSAGHPIQAVSWDSAVAVDRGAVAKQPVEKDDDEDDESGGIPVSTLLLGSYASAVTLGLLWVLFGGRHLREAPESPDFMPPADTRTDPGKRADRSRRVIAPPAIAAEHMTTLGKPVRLGEIEVTPLGVTSGTVTLERQGLELESKKGGSRALKLRLRLKNVSSDKVLAPLDEAFLRERIRAEPDSFIESSNGETIALYPMAVESEWSIVGQEFRDLKPGESFESVIVTAPDALDKKSAEMTWRVRLRTDVNHTDDLGVRVLSDEIKPES